MITHEQCERVRVPASLKEGGFKIPPTSAVLAAQFLLHQTQNVVSSPNSLNLQQFFFCDILDRKAHFSQAPSPPSINSCLALNAVRLFNSSPKRDTSAVSADVISPTSKQHGDVDVSCGWYSTTGADFDKVMYDYMAPATAAAGQIIRAAAQQWMKGQLYESEKERCGHSRRKALRCACRSEVRVALGCRKWTGPILKKQVRGEGQSFGALSWSSGNRCLLSGFCIIGQ